jgi:L,D-transpeptidase YcbB
MRATRLKRILAGSALALALAATGPSGAGAEEPSSEPVQASPAPGAQDVPDQARPILAADLPAADRPVAQGLSDILTGKSDPFFVRKQESAAVKSFYAARGYAPLWIANGAETARAQAAIARLRAAGSDGLDPADYPAPDFRAAAGQAEKLAEAELRLTKSVLAYVRHAQIGRVHFSRVSAEISYRLTAPDPNEVLAAIAAAEKPAEALASYNPQHEGFKLLRAKLAEVRSRRNEAARLGQGPNLKPGMRDGRVPALRERLGMPRAGADTTYDKGLAEAVKNFQHQHGLSATGQLNSATLDALNVQRYERDAEVIIANMERWRWLPRELGKAYVMVNIPDYSLQVVRDGATVWQTKLVAGKPATPTPLLSESMKYITVNPTWNVPPSIVQNEYLPALRHDSMALVRIGLRMEYNRDGTIHVFQPPGERNALGRIRFNFPNKFLVYQHDTPQKHLFAQDKRAYSHGCMRVQDPMKYAEILFSIARPNDGYTAERLQKMVGRSEQDITLPAPIPVHVTYQTASVDRSGKLQLREDVYGHDTRLLAALKGPDHAIADTPVERQESRPQQRQAVRLPHRSSPSRTASARGTGYQYNGTGYPYNGTGYPYNASGYAYGGWGYRYSNSNTTGSSFSWWR